MLFKVVVSIVDSDSQARELREKYKDNTNILYILSMQEIEYISGVEYLSLDILERFRDAQRKCEFVYHRWLKSGMLASNKYFNILGYFLHIFQSQNIDLVVVDGLEHGHGYDVPLYIAKEYNIPAFTISNRLFFSFSLLYFNQMSYIPLSSGHLSDEELDANFFYKLPLSTFVLRNQSFYARIKRKVRMFLYNIGGQILVDFVFCLKQRSFNLRQHVGNFPFNFWYKLSMLTYSKRMKAFYKKISHKPDYNQQFIFYAVHFEPEANTNVCVPLQNQLTCIQMISRALPKGVKLYVKEHPVQFDLNRAETSYYLYNFTYFKDISFYTELQKLPNVEFIDIDTSSKELIDNALAVATINGTVHFESTFNNRPCIVFGGYNIMLKGAKNLIYVEDFEGLKRDLQRLVTEPQSFDNSAQLQNLREFVKTHATFHTSPTKAKDIIDSIENFLQQEEKPESQNQPNNVKESTDSEQSKSNDYVRARLQGGGEAGFIPAQTIPLKGIE